jgi:surface polysaccharide O-acyltransferase-like enzyme
MSQPELHNRIAWVDHIRLIAVFFVVAVHVTAYGVVNEFNPHGPTLNWWACNFYGAALRCCVPFFVMLTGALLLPQQLPLGTFMQKRFKRILLPALFWGCVYIAYNIALQRNKAGLLSNWRVLVDWLSGQFLEGPVYSFWYIYMLIGLYLFIPILQPWIKSTGNKGLLYFLTIWLVTLALRQFSVLPPSLPVDLRYFGGYAGYLVLGHYLANRLHVDASVKLAAWIMLLTGFVTTFAGTYYMSVISGAFNNRLYEYLTLNVFLLSAGGFILLSSNSSAGSSPAFAALRNFITRYGFSIYLIHPLPLMIMVHFGLGYQVFTPLAGIPVTTLICLGITCFMAWIIGRLPYGKYITG